VPSGVCLSTVPQSSMIIPKKLPRDSNQRAFEIVRISTGEVEAEVEPERTPVSSYFAELGRKGGAKGGKQRAKNMSARKRTQIAKNAARARWKAKK